MRHLEKTVMNIKIDINEIIPLENFELGWRWQKSHNSSISEQEKKQILPISESESKKLDKVISYFEIEQNLVGVYSQTDWISASSESDQNMKKFQNLLVEILEPWNEDVIIQWHRNLTLKTTKELFIKYWDDFLYPVSDDVTVISEKTNWILFYRHFEVANIWVKR